MDCSSVGLLVLEAGIPSLAVQPPEAAMTSISKTARRGSISSFDVFPGPFGSLQGNYEPGGKRISVPAGGKEEGPPGVFPRGAFS
jgi:hypothetical protein